MRMTIDSSGLDALRQKLADARAALPDLLQEAALQAGEWIRQNLSEAAPVGQGGGPPPEGDQPGPLSESFYAQEETSAFSPGAAISVRTTQPTKLMYVTKGTGIYGKQNAPIVPTTKRALYWQGAAYPVRSVAGQQANDFVTPTLAETPDAQEVLGVVVEQLAGILES